MFCKSRLISFSILIFISFSGYSQTEYPENSFGRNEIRVYHPEYYFFDNISPNVINHLFNFGFSCSRELDNKKLSLRLSGDLHIYSGDLPEPIYLGNVFVRNALFFSFGVVKNIWQKKSLRINWFGEVNTRFGRQLVYAGGTENSWSSFPIDLTSIGLSCGAEFNYRLPFGLTFFTGIKQSFYYLRLDRGQPSSSINNGSPRSVLLYNFGLGWNFGKKRTE